jgi:hypothetical protein
VSLWGADDALEDVRHELIQDLTIMMALETAEREPMLQVWEDLHWAEACDVLAPVHAWFTEGLHTPPA